MAIRYLPSNVLRRMANKKRVEKLVKNNLTLNRAAFNSLAASNILPKKKLEEIAIKVIRSYRSSYGDERKLGVSKTEALETALNDKKLMVQRVQNASLNEITSEIKSQYAGEFYEWLPSDAEEPDPLHQLNYGKRFRLGKGEAPGDRYGCKCGMNILVDETELELEE